MLHEVLLALLGHSGGVFTDNGDGIKVQKDIPFIHPSEVDQLNHLCRLGTFFKDFNNFIKKHGGTLSLHTDGPGIPDGIHGLYLKAFCHGLDRVLDDYRLALENLEQAILRDPHLPLSHLLCNLQQFQILFPALASVIEQLVSHKAHGCYIIDILHKSSVCGLPLVKESLNRIAHVCNGVMFKQLCAWLLHGSLNDPYQEFFIQRSAEEQQDQSLQKQEEEDDLGLMGVTGRQLQTILSINMPDILTPSRHHFSVNSSLLPDHIPVRVANKILFVGESIQMFEDDKKPTSHKRGSILKSQEEEFAKALHELSRESEFNLMTFEALIDKIRTHVAEHLWTMLVEDANLEGNLKIIKDFFLLGRGELYLAFIDQAQNLLRIQPTGTTEHDVNMAFQQAARNVLISDDSLLQCFYLTVIAKQDKKESSASGSSVGGQSDRVENGWNYLGLTYTVEWPLHIFFTPKVLEKYNHVFKFLLAIKRTQMDLQHCWSLQMQHRNRVPTPGEGTKWQLRTHMSFLVDNLQYYLQVDVIESQFGILVDKIKSTRDFEAVRLAHDHFLMTLLSQSFVHMKSVSHCLNEILDQCGAFSRLVSNCENPMTERERTHLENIAKVDRSILQIQIEC
ncbi:hypothetical protein CHS0354_013711 [Potamilus streckersoni]|uniref:Gamma-tubulin complex component n=1 Tax=Potamilus streckersoni TaxID=2493646 RepID=A0AAE0TF44_9BIVA|nr:hypothetical protein CHS0354_013711 [Potamilus streckersoni]